MTVPEFSPPEPVHAAFIRVGDRDYLLTPGRRLILGSARFADIRVRGPGVSSKHARLSLGDDGRLLVRPLHGSSIRVERERLRGATRVPVGSSLTVGLTEIQSGPLASSLSLRVRTWLHDVRSAFGDSLQRTPWFLISLLFHVVVFLLVLLFLQRPPAQTTHATRRLSLEDSEPTELPIEEAAEDEAEEPIEEPAVPELAATPMVELPPAEDELAGDDLTGIGAGFDSEGLSGNDLFARVGKAKRSDGTLPTGLSKGFAKTIARLRKTGLEIVFAFDSTASMDDLLTDAKDDLLDIFLLLEELVPSTRMALMTYRDHRDEYLTRETRLGVGHFEALAFVSSVRAGGGGDFEEAVDAALVKAKKLHWRRATHKVVVIAGDAPPHKDKLKACRKIARWFARRRGQVHALIIGSEPSTWHAMRSIASAGGGKTFRREQRDQLALQLLTIALGPGSKNDVRKLLANREWRPRRRTERRTSALPSTSLLAKALAQPKPDPIVIDAWSWAAPKDFRGLEAKLRGVRLSSEGVFALVYALNRVLERQGTGTWIAPPRRSGKNTATTLPRNVRRALRRIRGG